MTAAVALALGVALSACGAPGGAASEPAATVRAYAAALDARDGERSYELLAAEARRETSPEEVSRQLESSRAELAELARELAANAGEVTAEARVPLADGGTVVVVWEDGEWRLAGDLLGMPRLHTPLEAVAALRKALERQSLRGVERVLSRSRRAALRAEIERIVDETSDELDLTVEIEGNRARVRTTGGRELLLVRELGEWHVAEIR